MKFSVKKTKLEGVLLIEITGYNDERGYFLESYNLKDFSDFGLEVKFVQDNESMSKKGVLRGLHFQKSPHEQGKLVRVMRGKIKDVVVDIRKNSSTYGLWESFVLDNNRKMLWVPEGFAHGFLSLEDNTIVQYKVTSFYNPEAEGGIVWNDPDLNIDWGETNPIVSEKDKKHPAFKKLIIL